MIFGSKKQFPIVTPVLVIDTLGISDRIRNSSPDELVGLSDSLDRQYHGFQAHIPFRVIMVRKKRVFSSGEFGTFRLNDMFVLFAAKPMPDIVHRHLVSAYIIYQAMLIEGFIPRGGLGFGSLLRRRDSVIGSGFIDAYEAAEKRHDTVRHICAVQLSNDFVANVPPSSFTQQLMCFYRGHFFLNPRAVVEPDLGKFDNDRILEYLRNSGANEDKLTATSKFLEEFEDYEAGKRPGSQSWQFIQSHLNKIGNQE